MFNKVTKSFQYGQHSVVLETGEIARQSSGAVLVTIEDTVVLATVVAKKDAKAGQDKSGRAKTASAFLQATRNTHLDAPSRPQAFHSFHQLQGSSSSTKSIEQGI